MNRKRVNGNRENQDQEPGIGNQKPGTRNWSLGTRLQRISVQKLRMIGSEKDLEGGLRCQSQTAWAVSKVP